MFCTLGVRSNTFRVKKKNQKPKGIWALKNITHRVPRYIYCHFSNFLHHIEHIILSKKGTSKYINPPILLSFYLLFFWTNGCGLVIKNQWNIALIVLVLGKRRKLNYRMRIPQPWRQESFHNPFFKAYVATAVDRLNSHRLQWCFMGPKMPTSRGCISVLFGASKHTQCCSLCRGRSPPGRHVTTDCHRWAVFCLAGRVSDPHWLNANPDTDPDPAFFLIADPDSGSGSRVWWSKIGKNLQLEI